MSIMTENDKAWQTFFDHTSTLQQIQEHGFCYVKAQDLKRVTQREPRLLAKQDRISDLPQVIHQQRSDDFSDQER